MSELEVRIVMLDSLRVASAYGFGASPEEIAFENDRGLRRGKEVC